MSFLDGPRIQALIERAEKPPGYVLPPGVSPDVLERARSREVPLPGAFVEWLELTNGPLVGPGGFYGLEPESPTDDLVDVLAMYPHWAERGWVPVTSDGTGNQYLLMPQDEDGPVGFFEMIRDTHEPEMVVGSNLNTFLIGILERELGGKWWPFEAERMLAFDPGLALVDPLLLPWADSRPKAQLPPRR